MTGLLSLSIALPVIGSLVLLFIPNRDGSKDAVIRNLAFAFSMVVFAVTLLLWAGFDASAGAPEFQFVERYRWMPAFGIEAAFGVDGISLLLIVLTGFLTPLALLGSWQAIQHRARAFCILVLLLESAMMGVFASTDLFLFYVFWDAVLIPMYFLIGIWGYDDRVYAALKFLLYTLTGSVLMLVAILTLAYLHQQLAAHTEALTLHREYAAAGDNEVLKGVASAAVPKIEHHLGMVREAGGDKLDGAVPG